MVAPAGESRGRRKGQKEEGKEVRWRLTGEAGSTEAQAPTGGFGGARLGRSWAESGSRPDGWLLPTQEEFKVFLIDFLLFPIQFKFEFQIQI
jgi:hypothetical protein